MVTAHPAISSHPLQLHERHRPELRLRLPQPPSELGDRPGFRDDRVALEEHVDEIRVRQVTTRDRLAAQSRFDHVAVVLVCG
jgi:hypothetical protein